MIAVKSPAKIIKKPARLTPVPVGKRSKAEPEITSDVDTIISLAERTLMKFISIIFIIQIVCNADELQIA